MFQIHDEDPNKNNTDYHASIFYGKSFRKSVLLQCCLVLASWEVGIIIDQDETIKFA
jgi:hypothetical protein